MDWGSIIVDIEPAGTVTLLDLYKLHMGIEDNTQDAELNRSLEMAGNACETWLDRVLAKREVLEQFPHHFGTVVLHNYPVDAQANLTVYLNGVAQSDYSIWLARGGLGHLSRTEIRPDMPMDWRKYDQVGVTYTAGFDPLPSDISQAIIYTATPILQAEGGATIPGGGGGSGEVKSMTIYDVGSISYDVGSSASSGGSGLYASLGIIPETAAHMLTRYKRMAA